jgi:hypothetical protein
VEGVPDSSVEQPLCPTTKAVLVATANPSHLLNEGLNATHAHFIEILLAITRRMMIPDR